MALAAKVSSSELTAQVTNRFVDAYFEARLINAPGTSYTPGITDDTSFLSFAVTPGTGGYYPQSIGYTSGDVLAYSDDGVPLNTKSTIFAHDGGATAIDFSHVALVWTSGVTTAIGGVDSAPSAGVNGTYTNILQSSSSGSGTGLMINITVTNSGATAGDYAVTLSNGGTGYVAAEAIVFTAADLITAGVCPSGATGSLAFAVSTVSSPGPDEGNILAVAQTTNAVTLTGGNEAVFYWNLKQFGYYAV
jgi:hypothetical protein